ncbi:MAG: NAD-dependent epimerase/dehydratase family protein [Alphaproteobacteria bacterium]|nr:NAD-dependent epimerase/dehydratase family protein [Alphaproteobacteria bacterium]
MKRVLLTGAAGDVGRRITPMLKAAYGDVVLSDLKEPSDTHGLSFVKADLADFAQVAAAVRGVEGIVHLGGYSVEGPWESILSANIVGCYNLFEAARQAGTKRIIFASSNHAVGFYPRSTTIPHDVTVLPDSRYGVSKAFGEALGAMYAMKHGMKVTALRIGNVNDTPLDLRRMAIMLHPEDLMQLIRIGLDHPDIAFEVFYGASNNSRAWWDNSRAKALGYRPKYDSEAKLDAAQKGQALATPDPVGDFFQGGTFCAAEYTADFAALKNWRAPTS